MDPSLSKLSAADRRLQIRTLLLARPEMPLAELAAHFDVSEMTIRRDLEALDRSGQIRRSRGRAEVTERMVFEFDFRDRRDRELPYKQAIARQAAGLIGDGARVLIDTGTTTLELASELCTRSGLTVITSSLAVVSQMLFAEGVEVILLGGVVRRGNADLTGALTEYSLEFLAADFAFQGADAIGLDGSLYNADMRLAHVDRCMRKRAEHSFVLADSTKLGHTALARNGHLREVEALITDSRITPAQHEALLGNEARLLIATPESEEIEP